MKERDGTFNILDGTADIELETKIYGIKFISTIPKLLLYVKSKFLEAQKIYLE